MYIILIATTSIYEKLITYHYSHRMPLVTISEKINQKTMVNELVVNKTNIEY